MCPPGLFDRPAEGRAVHIIRESLHILLDASYRFNRDDGWAIASHIALSILMSVFPFLIVVTAMPAFLAQR
jgi:membrane protein